jgi:hypothetical protein
MATLGLASTWGVTMLRAIVLMLCLVSAGAIAAYSYYSHDATDAPVYTVPHPSSHPAPKAVAPQRIAPEDQAALARALQKELKRVGCYNGEINGVWTTSSRLAMKTFVEQVNAALPIDRPDPVLLSLVHGHRERACGVGETADAAKEAPPDARPDADKTGAAAAVAGAAAATALAAGAGAKPDAKASTPEAGPRIEPPEPKRARRPKRSKAPRPPKVVSDFMKLFGK